MKYEVIHTDGRESETHDNLRDACRAMMGARCEHCGIETTGARDDQGHMWPICGECLRETLEIARAAQELADDVCGRRPWRPQIEKEAKQ